VSPYITHRDERFFPDPETFNPMRWADDCAAHGRSDYFPFGLGPRRCIGEFLAVGEMTLAVATLCQAWRLEGVGNEPVEPEALVTLRPSREIMVRILQRARDRGACRSSP
jgi:cytochrome P450